MSKYDVVEPGAAAMLESMRAYGYSPATALADLIDNSISAQARTVWIDFHWAGSASYLTLLDDGKGMTPEEVTQAMRLGSRSPIEKRTPQDLGRFGLGLKTASFSQCRRLTVATKRSARKVTVRRWDLDYIGRFDKWRLLHEPHELSLQRIEPLAAAKHGTLVLWEEMDRLTGGMHRNDRTAEQRFYEIIHSVEEHLAMVFHRYLEGTSPRLKIYINGEAEAQRVKPWDPFLGEPKSAIPFPEEPIATRAGVMKVKGFVLPHKDKLGDKAHKNAAGPAGWNAHQGFYIYRNERLLVPGSWLGLGSHRPWTKEEHYKLARIRVLLPNTLDLDWQIDVKKSSARPPAEVRDRLKMIAELVRSRAREVFSHRGAYTARQTQPLIRIWQPITIKGHPAYRVDRTHPLVHSVLEKHAENRKRIEAMLRMIEETIPVQQIWLDTAEKPDQHARPYEDSPPEAIKELIAETLDALIATEGISGAAARRRLMMFEAFAPYKKYIEKLT